MQSNLQERPGNSSARRLLQKAPTVPQALPLRNQLTRRFSREVAAAVEAAIANRTRALVEKTPASGGRSAATADERWPTLDEHQWSYINRVLARTHGNKSEAAAMLGLHRRSLQRLLRRNSKGHAPRASSKPGGPKPIVTGDGTIVLEALTFSQIERAILSWALHRHAGSGRQAARSLGLARSTFADKVNRYELKPRAAKRRATAR
jgi:DNA-binding NtrC family response regulator